MEEQRTYIGIASPEATEQAVQRWFQFMIWPGFGWVGLLGFFTLPLWAASIVAYAVLYSAFAYAWPNTFRCFWSELVAESPSLASKLSAHARALGAAVRANAVSFFFRVARAFVWCFRASSKWLADSGSGAVAYLNKLYKGEVKLWARKPAAPKAVPFSRVDTTAHARYAMAGLGGVAESEAPAEDPSPSPKRIDWSRVLRNFLDLRVWALLFVCLALIFLARGCADVSDLFTPSGAEVAANARAENAEVNEVIAAHERAGVVAGQVQAEQTHEIDRASREHVARAQARNNDALQQRRSPIDEEFFADLHARYHADVERVWSDAIVSPRGADLPPPRARDLFAS